MVLRLLATMTATLKATGKPSVKESFDFAVGFSRQPLSKGNRFAIVTNAGGPGITATNATIRHGLDPAILRPETIESLKAKQPPTARFSNAVDVIGDPTVGGLVARLTPQSATGIVPELNFGRTQFNISTFEEARAGYKINHKRGETKAIQCAAPRCGNSSDGGYAGIPAPAVGVHGSRG